MIKTLHVTLAYITVAGFLLRAYWSFAVSDNLQKQWIRIAPHVIDTLLLICGVSLAISLSLNLASGWLVAKLIGLLTYIGFGVMTLRGTGRVKVVGLLGALLAVTYIFLVAHSKSPWLA
jgi:uncharacterized membrane protein SirB2